MLSRRGELCAAVFVIVFADLVVPGGSICGGADPMGGFSGTL